MSQESELIKNTVVEQDTLSGQGAYQESNAEMAGVVDPRPWNRLANRNKEVSIYV